MKGVVREGSVKCDLSLWHESELMMYTRHVQDLLLQFYMSSSSGCIHCTKNTAGGLGSDSGSTTNNLCGTGKLCSISEH